MIKIFIFCLMVYSTVALLETDKCPKDNEKPGLLEKSCEDGKYEVKKELTCVCTWFYFRKADGECVKSDDCGKETEPTEKPIEKTTQKQYSYCPEGYELVLVSCHRHGGYYGGQGGYYDGYDKKCKVCKKKY